MNTKENRYSILTFHRERAGVGLKAGLVRGGHRRGICFYLRSSLNKSYIKNINNRIKSYFSLIKSI